MAPKLSLEARMTIIELLRRGWSRVAIAKSLGVTEGSVRYHDRRRQEGKSDGRVGRQQHRLAALSTEVEAWLSAEASRRERLNLGPLHADLVVEHGYTGSLRSVQRYFRLHPAPPRLRPRRRVETPAGAQGQADWAFFSEVVVARRAVDLLGFHLQLSWSRFAALVWALRKDQLSWQEAHIAALTRLGGVPACIRVDNEKTAVVRGAGAWGEHNPAYERFAQRARFHIDLCPPRAPEAKGKIERRIRDHRHWLDPRCREWDSLEELQVWTDGQVRCRAERRQCPSTGGSVLEAWEQERPLLGGSWPYLAPSTWWSAAEWPTTVRFISRGVPTRFPSHCWRGRWRSTAAPAKWRSATREIWWRPTPVVRRGSSAPQPGSIPRASRPTGCCRQLPWGGWGQRLAEIAAMEPEKRPLDLYAACAEVAR